MRTLFLSVILALFLLFAGFFSVYYDASPGGFYAWHEEFLGQERSDQMTATLAYLNGGDEELLSFYTANEASHLTDVRKLLSIVKSFFVLLLILIGLGAFSQKAAFQRSLFWGGIGAIGLTLLLSMLSLFDFTWFWYHFHEVLFPQGNYAFSAESTLITLFPEWFFITFAMQVFLATMSYGCLTLLAYWSLRTRQKS